jgi:hypothetical protein
MMIERLPRQAGGLGDLFDRRPPETVPAKHPQRGVENAIVRFHLGLHLTNLTK